MATIFISSSPVRWAAHCERKEPRSTYTQGESFGEAVHNVPHCNHHCPKRARSGASTGELQKIILLTKATLDTRLQMVKMCKVFASLTDKQMSLIAAELQEVAVEEGGIVAEGDLADSLYLIKEGTVSVPPQPQRVGAERVDRCPPGRPRPRVVEWRRRQQQWRPELAASGRGDGQRRPGRGGLRVLRRRRRASSLCADQHRLASVVAKTAVTLLKLTRESFGTLFGYGRTWAHSRCALGAAGEPAVVRSSSQVQLEHDLEMLVRRNLTRRLVADLDFLSPLSASEKEMLCEHLYEAPFVAGQTIIRQGDPAEQATTFYMVKSGAVRITQRNADGQTVVLKEHQGRVLRRDVAPAGAAPCDGHGDRADRLHVRRRYDVQRGARADVALPQGAAPSDRDIDSAQRAATWLEDLRVHRILGVGAFGVKLVTHEPGGKKDEAAPAYALKCISKGQVRKLQQVEHVLNEKNILAMCRHLFCEARRQVPGRVRAVHAARARAGRRALHRADAPPRRAAVGARSLLHRRDHVGARLPSRPQDRPPRSAGERAARLGGLRQARRLWPRQDGRRRDVDLLRHARLRARDHPEQGHAEPVDWWASACCCTRCSSARAPLPPTTRWPRIGGYCVRPQVCAPARAGYRGPDPQAPRRHAGVAAGVLDPGGATSRRIPSAPLNFAKLLQREVTAPYVPPITSPLDASNFEQPREDEGDEKPAALNTEYWNQYHDEASDKQTFADF